MFFKFISWVISPDKVKARHFHSAKHFIDNICGINDGGESKRYICEIHPIELEIKIEHQSDHATFLHLNIVMKERTFIWKLLDKRDSFLFSVVRTLHTESNNHQHIFSSARKGEFLRIHHSTRGLRYFMPKAKELLAGIKPRSSNCSTTGTSLRKIILYHPDSFDPCRFHVTTYHEVSVYIGVCINYVCL